MPETGDLASSSPSEIQAKNLQLLFSTFACVFRLRGRVRQTHSHSDDQSHHRRLLFPVVANKTAASISHGLLELCFDLSTVLRLHIIHTTTPPSIARNRKLFQEGSSLNDGQKQTERTSLFFAGKRKKKGNGIRKGRKKTDQSPNRHNVKKALFIQEAAEFWSEKGVESTLFSGSSA